MSKKPRVRHGLPWKRVVVALLLGAVVNVLVAWGAVVYSPTEVPAYEGTVEQFSRSRSAVAEDVSFPIAVPPGWSSTAHVAIVRRGTAYAHEHYVSQVTNTGTHHVVITRAGWPLYTLRATAIFEQQGTGLAVYSTTHHTNEFVRGYELRDLPPVIKQRFPSDAGGSLPIRQRYIPFVPTPLRFGLNSVIFAVPISVFLFGLAALKLRRRSARGLCIHCTYDRAGISVDKACPECGGTHSAVRG